MVNESASAGKKIRCGALRSAPDLLPKLGVRENIACRRSTRVWDASQIGEIGREIQDDQIYAVGHHRGLQGLDALPGVRLRLDI